MKKVLIVSHAMELGGAENALLGLLEQFDTSKYQVDLFLLGHHGELLPYIPLNIRLLPEKRAYSCMAVPITHVFKKGEFFIAWGRLIGKRKAKKRNQELNFTDSDISLEYSHKYTVHYMPMISDEEYDTAISFLTPHYYVAQKVKAKKKIAWIHTDYSKVSVDTESQLAMWQPYDHIVSISERVTESFCHVFPSLKDKVVEIGNMLPAKYIEKISQQGSADDEMPENGTTKLLSIGRFCTAKNFDNIPEIAKYMLSADIKFHWYIIGYGGDEALIRNRIAEFHMEDTVIILGKKANPYPYIKACDIYIQPSRYEGKCVSVIEAQSMHKPVIITNYETASSQLQDGLDGVIVPMENEKCAKGISAVIKNTELKNKLIKNTKRKDYTNRSEIQKLYDLMG